ncbi:MAG: acyltransferase [Calothrix sp. MO_192.B10]|nr:acyltransferase [Calothrix sp. MO_192.B10]
MLIYFWRQGKKFPYLREVLAYVYYAIQQNVRRVTGVGNQISINLANSFPHLRNTSLKIHGNHNFIIIHSGSCLSNLSIEINGSHNRLLIEENCHIEGGCLWMNDHQGNLKIGSGTTIKQANIGLAESGSSILIGNDCMFAHGVDIRCSDSHSIVDCASMQRINYAKDINIGDHVWLAANVQILKGVCIGNDSVVAARSVVTKDVPENCIVAGIPAQVKQTGITWLRENLPKKDSSQFTDS